MRLKIYVIAPGTGEHVPASMVARMRLPLRYGWDAWLLEDEAGRSIRFRSYRALRAHQRSSDPPSPAGFLLPERIK
ncbi:hypothetical protein [Ensifer soli]|uniref:hypothetical protein n=1 Tax=Ciceribacter sp. sgz301302 TaxID=3342379 RepID=UPI0035BA3CCA